jgi:uncharacterized membrane protein
MIKKVFRFLMNYFFQGLLFLAPVAITIWALFVLFNWINGILQPYIDQVIGINIPGLGIVILLVIILLIGFLGSTIVFRPIISYFDRLMIRAPLIKILYTAVKDLVSAFVGKKKRFNQPVLVRLGDGLDIERIGFLTNNDLSILGDANEKVAVYLPHSYAWSGNLIVVPAGNVTPIGASSTEVMKFIISAGLTQIDD